MTKLLASFDFANSEFDITEQSHNDIYLKIYRELICLNNTNQKHHMPIGGNGGLATRFIILLQGKRPPNLVWELSKDKQFLQAGFTHNPDISIPLDDCSGKKYTIKIYQPSNKRIGKITYNDTINITTQHKLVLLQLRNNILDRLKTLLTEEIPDILIQYGSNHLDNSTHSQSYKHSIRVEVPDKALYHILPEYDQGYNISVYSYYLSSKQNDVSTMQLGNHNIKINNILTLLTEHIRKKDSYIGTLRSSPVASL